MSNNLLSFSAEDYLPSILGRIIDTISGQRRKLHNCYAKIDAYFETTLREHLHKHERTKGEVDEDYVDVLIRLSKEPKFPFSEQHIKAMFMDIFLGGIDTIQNEIRRSIGRKEKLTEEDITNLKYLKMVSEKETFPGFHIRLSSCFHMKPPDIAKLKMPIAAFQVSTETTGDEFYPERFENSEIDFKGTNFELIPFGAGRRICPGLAMAINSIEYILTNLLYFFDWELPDGVKIEGVSMEEIVGITIHKKIPLHLKPIKYM
ncbi:hypothetical protein Leryth_001940 [Lithospermum erythrorhizon]|nr:hypothetical protein Leryth_001940 [Lithospermum erythrorhizon]